MYLGSQVFVTESCCWLTGPFKIAKNGRNSSFLHMARPSHDGRALAFGPPKARARPSWLGLAMCKKLEFRPFFAILKGPVNQQQLSVTNTWLPKYISEHHPLVNATPLKTNG